MDKQKTLTIILSGINVAWLLFSLSVFSRTQSTGLIMLIPLAIGMIAFVIMKKIKNFETIRALKYANLFSIVPIGIIIALYFLFFKVVQQPLAGIVAIDPVYKSCWQTCQNKTQEITNATYDCVQKCIENLRNK